MFARVVMFRLNYFHPIINENIFPTSTGTKTIHKKVPDTITSWVITGFTMNEVYGLGLTKSPSTLKVFQPFFISLNLPYSIKRGEAVAIQIVVFNYMDAGVTAAVTLENPNQEFVYSDPSNEVVETPSKYLSRHCFIHIVLSNTNFTKTRNRSIT